MVLWTSKSANLTRCLLTGVLMIPVHIVEGLARPLYQALAAVYEPGRQLYSFGEDHFEAALQGSDRVLELGSGTGYLARRLARRAGSDFETSSVTITQWISITANYLRTPDPDHLLTISTNNPWEHLVRVASSRC